MRHRSSPSRATWRYLVNTSRVGIVLVTPALLRSLPREGIADKELSALLATDLLVPIVHNTTYEALREVSPLLGSRSGLSTTDGPMADVAAKLAELVAQGTRGQQSLPGKVLSRLRLRT